jgi:hypothetical protein
MNSIDDINLDYFDDEQKKCARVIKADSFSVMENEDEAERSSKRFSLIVFNSEDGLAETGLQIGSFGYREFSDIIENKEIRKEIISKYGI